MVKVTRENIVKFGHWLSRLSAAGCFGLALVQFLAGLAALFTAPRTAIMNFYVMGFSLLILAGEFGMTKFTKPFGFMQRRFSRGVFSFFVGSLLLEDLMLIAGIPMMLAGVLMIVVKDDTEEVPGAPASGEGKGAGEQAGSGDKDNESPFDDDATSKAAAAAPEEENPFDDNPFSK